MQSVSEPDTAITTHVLNESGHAKKKIRDNFSTMRIVSSFGVATARHQTAICVRGDSFCVALGCCVATWRGGSRVSIFQAHDDAVAAIIWRPPVPAAAKRHDEACTISVGGEVKLWLVESATTWTEVARTRVSKDRALEAAWDDSGRLLAVMSEGSGGGIEIFSVDGPSFVKVSSVDGTFLYMTWNSAGDHVIASQAKDDFLGIASKGPREKSRPVEKKSDAPAGGSPSPQLPKDFSLVKVFSAKDGKQVSEQIVPGGSLPTTGCTTAPGDAVWAFAVGSMAVVVDRKSAAVTASFQMPGAARIVKALCLTGDCQALLFPTDRGTMSSCSVHGGPATATFPCAAGSTYFVGLVSPSSLLQITESALAVVPFPPAPGGKVEKVAIAEITAVGIDFHPSQDWLAIGDMAGNVFCFDHSVSPAISIVASANVMASVRSMCWNPSGTALIVGDMAGNIHSWSPSAGNLPRVVFGLNGSITQLQWRPPRVGDESGGCLAASTTDGTLALLQSQPGDDLLRPILVFKAHRAAKGQQDLQFGSLTKFAEIWSLAWSPDGGMLATSSEDQTTRIWTTEGEAVRTLTGHTTAVTSVKWKRAQGTSPELLVTCADDMRVMVWDPVKWELLRTLQTDQLDEWHTLTYVCIEPGPGIRVVAVTQNGYAVFWDALSGTPLSHHKIHAASIEGLVWDSRTSLIATCSSDCSAAVFTI